MKTEYIWGIVSLLLIVKAIIDKDLFWILVNLGFLGFNIYQVMRGRKK